MTVSITWTLRTLCFELLSISICLLRVIVVLLYSKLSLYFGVLLITFIAPCLYTNYNHFRGIVKPVKYVKVNMGRLFPRLVLRRGRGRGRAIGYFTERGKGWLIGRLYFQSLSKMVHKEIATLKYQNLKYFMKNEQVAQKTT